MKKLNFFNIVLTLICTLSLTKCGGDGCKYPDEIALGGLWEEMQTLTVRPINASVIAKENSYGIYTLKDGTTEMQANSNLWHPLLMRNGEYAVVEAGKKMKLIVDGAVTLSGYSQFINATLNKWISTEGPLRYMEEITVSEEPIKYVEEDRVPTIDPSKRDKLHLNFRQNLSDHDGIIPVQWSDFKVKPGDELPITISVANFGLSPAMVKTHGCTSGNCYANLSGGHGLMLYLFPDLPDVKKEGLYTDPEQWQCNMGLAGSYAFYRPYKYNPDADVDSLIDYFHDDQMTKENPRDIDNPHKHNIFGAFVTSGLLGIITKMVMDALKGSSPEIAYWYCEDAYVQMWFSGYDFKGTKKVEKGVPEMHKYAMIDVNTFLPDFQYDLDGKSRLTNQTIDCASDHIPNKIYLASGGSLDKHTNSISLVEDYSLKKYQYTDNNGGTATMSTDDANITSKVYPQATPRELTVYLPAQSKEVKVTKDGNNLQRTTTDNKTFFYEFDVDGVHKKVNVNSLDVRGASCLTREELMKKSTAAGASDPYYKNVSSSDCDDYCVTNDNGETIFTRYGPFAGFHTSTSATVLPAIFESYGMCRGGKYMAAEDSDLGKLFIYDKQKRNNPSSLATDIAKEFLGMGGDYLARDTAYRSPLDPYWRVEFSSPSAEKNSPEVGQEGETNPPDMSAVTQQVRSSCYLKTSSECAESEVPSSMIVNLKNTIGWKSGDPTGTVFITRNANSITGYSNFEYKIQCVYAASHNDCMDAVAAREFSPDSSGAFIIDSNDPRIVDDGVLCGGIPNCGPKENPSTIEMILSSGRKITLTFTAASGGGIVQNAKHVGNKTANHYYKFTYNNRLYTIKQNMVSDFYKNCLEDTLRCSSWLDQYINSGKTRIYKAFPLNTDDPECFEDGAIGSLGRAPYVVACAHGHKPDQPFYNGGYRGVGDQYKYAYMPLYDQHRKYSPSSYFHPADNCESHGKHHYNMSFLGYYGGLDAIRYEESSFMNDIKAVNEQIGYTFHEKEFRNHLGSLEDEYDVESAFVLKSNVASYLKDRYFSRCTPDWKTPGWMLLNNSGDISSINGEDSAVSGVFFEKPDGPSLSEAGIRNDYDMNKVHAKYGGMVFNTIYHNSCSGTIPLQASSSNPTLDAGEIKKCHKGSIETFTPNFTTIYDKQIILVKNVINDPINASDNTCTVSGGGGSVAIKMNEPFGNIITASNLSKFWASKTFKWSGVGTDLGQEPDDPDAEERENISTCDPQTVADIQTRDSDFTCNVSDEVLDYDTADIEKKDGKIYGVSRYETANGDIRYRNSAFKATEAARNLVGAGMIHAIWHPLKNSSNNVQIFNKGHSIRLTASGGTYHVMNGLSHHSRAYCYDENKVANVFSSIVAFINIYVLPVISNVVNGLINRLGNAEGYKYPGVMDTLNGRGDDNFSVRNCGTGLAFRVVPIPEFACLSGYDTKCSNQRINSSYTSSADIASHCVTEAQSVSWTDKKLQVGKCTKVEYDIETKQQVLVAGTTTPLGIPQRYDSTYPIYRMNTLIDGPTGGGGFSDQENIIEGQCGICVKRESVLNYNGVTYTNDDLMVPMPVSVRSEESCNSFEDDEGSKYIFVTDVAKITPWDKYSSTERDDIKTDIENAFRNAISYCQSAHSIFTNYTYSSNITTDEMEKKTKAAFEKISIRNKPSCIAIVEQIHSKLIESSINIKTVSDTGSKTTVSGWTLETENDERKRCRERLHEDISVYAEQACDAMLLAVEAKDGKNYHSYVFSQNALSAVCKDDTMRDSTSGGYHSIRDLDSDSLEKHGYVQLTKNGEIYKTEEAVTYNVKIPDKINGRSFVNANVGFVFAGDHIADGPMRLYKNFKIDSKEDLVRGYLINLGGSTPITKGKYLYLYFQPLTTSGKPDPNYNPNTYYSTTMPNPINHMIYTPEKIIADKDVYNFKDFDDDDDGIALFTAPASGKVWFAILDVPEIDPATGLNKTPEKDGKAIIFKADDPLAVVNGDNYLSSNSGHYIISGKMMIDDTDFVGGLLKSKYEKGSTFLTETIFNKLIIRPIKTIFFGWDNEQKKYDPDKGFLYQLLKHIYSWPLLHLVYYIIVVFSVMMFGAKIMFGLEKTDTKSIMSKFLRYALIAGFLNPSWMGLYTHWFVEGSFNVADGLSAYVAGNFTGSTYTESDAGNFIKIAFGPVDTIFRFWFKIETIERFLAILFSSWVGWISAILLLLCLVHFIISVLEVLFIYIAIMFRMFIHLMMGPFFFIFLAFKSTEKRWETWWKELAGLITEQVCIFTALSVFCTIYYHVLKGALGFAYCWEPVLKIPILNITLLSMWKIAGQLPTHMAEMMGDFGPRGSGYSSNQGFSILTGLCLFLLTNVMGKFVDKASKFGASLWGSGSTSEFFNIQQLAQGLRQGANKFGAGGAKKIGAAQWKAVSGNVPIIKHIG